MRSYYHDTDGDVLMVEVDDALNADQAEAFVDEIEAAIESGLRKVIIDCTDLRFLTTNGIGMLLRLHKRLTERGGEARLVNLHGLAADVIHTVRLDRVFHLYKDRDSARRASHEGAAAARK